MTTEHPEPRPRRWRTAIATTTASALLLSAASYTVVIGLAPVEPLAPQLVTLDSVTTPASTVTLPDYGGSAIGDADGEHIYAGRDLDTPRPIASIAKVITALVVLTERPIEAGSPGATLTLTAQDASLVRRYSAINGVTAPAPAGRDITQREVIELMLVYSANNYAETLAVWAFGSVEAYLVAARQWLDDRGLTEISVGDPTGFSTLNAASPRNLLELARIAIADPTISAAAALSTVSITGIGTFSNRNLVIGVDGITGLKTGTLSASGSSLLFSAEGVGPQGDQRVVGVVLNGPDQPRVAADVLALLASVGDDFHDVTLVDADTVVARYTAPWGGTAELRVVEPLVDTVWGPITSRLIVHAPELQPGRDAEPPGVAQARYAGESAVVRLEWVGTIEAPPLEWRLWQPVIALLGGNPPDSP